jgi:hypothetical protein
MRLTLYPPGAGEPRPLEDGNIQNYDSAGFFPDGIHVLACGNEVGQASRCYVQELTGGSPHAVTPLGTTRGLASPDGNSILARESGGKFLIYPLTGGPPRPVPGTMPDEQVIRWSLDGRSVLIYRHGIVPARVERLELATGKRTLVRQLAPPSQAGVLDILSVAFDDDEQSYAYTYNRYLCRLASLRGVR